MTAIMHAAYMQSSRLPRILGITRNNDRASGCSVGIDKKPRCQHGIHIYVLSSKDKKGLGDPTLLVPFSLLRRFLFLLFTHLPYTTFALLLYR